MRIGIPKEIKVHERRVGATPDLVCLLVQSGHEVCVETNAGEALGYTNALYIAAGAHIVPQPSQVYEADLVIKVKEPQEKEYGYLREGQILFCYLHLAAEPELTQKLVESRCVAIAYETVTDARGRLPLLTPMSEIAGRLSIQVGATALQMNHGGRGTLLGGVPGVAKGNVVVIGGGVAGTEAARMALGLGANVTVLDRDISRLRDLENMFGSALDTRYSTPVSVEEAISTADLVVGAVLIPGKRAPCVVTREMVKKMPVGSVIVDISIDQGGCFETSRPTTHENPTYIEERVVHYCVTNMPGAAARTATQALTNATTPYVLALANKGYKRALQEDVSLQDGLNVYRGTVTNREVAEEFNYVYTISPYTKQAGF